MDKKIKSAKHSMDKKMDKLVKEDKKRDKKCEHAEKMMHKKKKQLFQFRKKNIRMLRGIHATSILSPMPRHIPFTNKIKKDFNESESDKTTD